MRWIHTADWHLGKLFEQRSMTQDQAYVLEELLDIVKEEKAEAVVIAGDVYDRGVPPQEAVDLFGSVLRRLTERGVKVLYIAGNHDSASRIDFGRGIMEQAGVFARGRLDAALSPIVLEDEAGPVYFSLLPYAGPAEVRSCFGTEEGMSFDAAMAAMVGRARQEIPAGVRSVAVAHAFIAGGISSESERPLSVGGSDQVSPKRFAGFSYTALGHLHGPQKAGAEMIRYSGSLLKYSFDEAGQKKGVLVVDLPAAGSASAELIPLVPCHEVRVLKGDFESLRDPSFDTGDKDDYLKIELTDRDLVLNSFDRLREVYPNLIALEQPNRIGAEASAAGDLRLEGAQRMSNLELFARFYQDQAGKALSPEQEKVVTACFQEILEEEREKE